MTPSGEGWRRLTTASAPAAKPVVLLRECLKEFGPVAESPTGLTQRPDRLTRLLSPRQGRPGRTHEVEENEEGRFVRDVAPVNRSAAQDSASQTPSSAGCR